MPKHRHFTAQFYANNSVSIYDRRKRVHLADNGGTPTNNNKATSTKGGCTSGVSLRDIRHLMRPSSHIHTKKLSSNGLNVHEVVAACPWDKDRYTK